MTIQEMIDEREALLAEAEELDKKAQSEEGVTDEEDAKISANLERAEELKNEIADARKKDAERAERRKKLEAEKAWGESPQPRQTRQAPLNPANGVNANITGGEASDKFSHFGEFIAGVRRSATIPDAHNALAQKIVASSGLNTAIDSEGGFLIPPQFSEEIMAKMYERGEILGRVRTIPLSGNEYKMPTVNESSRADGSRWGGVRAYWTEEGGTPTATKPDFGQVSLRLKKVACLGYVTEEQLEDAPATGSYLMDAFTDEMMFAVENAIINGTGAGQPLGILNAACTVSVAKETNQTASTLWGPNVTKMWARTYARSRQSAVWFYEQSVEPYLWSLALEGRYGSASTSADAIPLYMPAGTVMNQGEYPTLFGRPAIPVEYCKALGTAGDIVVADLSQYLFAVSRSGMKQATSMHVRFIYDELAFKVTWRVDGRPWWQAALTPYSAGDTLSPFVTVDAR